MNAPATRFNANVNGLRGLCVAMVFVFHLAGAGLTPPPDAGVAWQMALAYLVGAMAHGVEVFFMISGYVIVLSLRRHASVRAFLADRCLRILPAWFGVLALIVALAPWLGWREVQAFDALGRFGVVLANALLLPPLLPLPMLHPGSWSLSLEGLFYLVAAAIAALSRDGRVAPVVWRPIAVLLVGFALWRYPVALCFLIGVAVALFDPVPASVRQWPGAASIALLLFGLLWRSVDAAGLDTGATLTELLVQGQGPALVGAGVAGSVLFACVAAPGSRSLPVLRSTFLQGLGTISYSFYLWHLLVMFGAKRAVMRLMPDAVPAWTATLVFVLVSTLLSWALAWLSWRFLEQALGGLRRPRVGLAS